VRSSLIQRRVLVTGAAGTIGSQLVPRLAGAGYVVTALVRNASRAIHLAGLPGVDLCEGDVTDPRLLDKVVAGIDQVFHLAACVHAPPSTPEAWFYRVNRDGTRYLVEASLRGRVRSLVHFSTVAVYGENDQILDEDSPVAPSTPYAHSKLAAEEILREATHGTPLKTTILRLPVVYGRGDRGNVGRLIEAIRRHRYLIIGDGHNEKSMLAVANAVDAALLVAEDERSRDRTYIVTDRRSYSQLEIARTIAELLGEPRNFFHLPYRVALALGASADMLSHLCGYPLPLSRERVRKLAQNTRYCSERIQKELLYQPRQTLREGLAEMID
jgi:nucleoside-diphosphate-sugar epimerase